MLLTDAAKNAALDAFTAIAGWVGLASAYPGSGGANEISGGSPAYGRKAAGWASAAAGNADGGTSTFDVPGNTTVAWLTYWSAASGGTYRGCLPAQGDAPSAAKPFACTDDTTDTLFCEDHGFTNGQQVVVWATPVGGASLPAGLTEGTIYFVIGATTDTLQLSATSGGAAVNITDEGHGRVQRIIPETYGAQGVYIVNDHDVAIEV